MLNPRRDPAPAELDDLTLARAQRGEAAACRALVERYQRPVFALLGRMCGPGRAEDLAQETFLRVFNALPRFERSGPARLSTWILTIATRLALDELRRRPLRTVELDEGIASPSRADETAEIARLRSRVAELEGHGAAAATPTPSPDPPPGPPFHLHPSHDELLAMAKDCKVQFDMPNMASPVPFSVAPPIAAKLGLSDEEAAAVAEAVSQAMARTQAQIRALYVEVTGNSAASEELSFDAIVQEIEEKGGDEGSAKRQLAEERAGLTAVPLKLTDRSPTERMLRALSATGNDVEHAIAGVIGRDRAQALRGEGWGSTWSMSGCPAK